MSFFKWLFAAAPTPTEKVELPKAPEPDWEALGKEAIAKVTAKLKEKAANDIRYKVKFRVGRTNLYSDVFEPTYWVNTRWSDGYYFNRAPHPRKLEIGVPYFSSSKENATQYITSRSANHFLEIQGKFYNLEHIISMEIVEA
jgi:hypothetical protein